MSTHQRMTGATCAGCGTPGTRGRKVSQRDLGSADKWHAECYRDRLPVSAVFVNIGTGTPWAEDGTAYSVTLECDGRTMRVPFYVGSGWDRTPTVREVLESLFSDAPYADEDPWEMVAELGSTDVDEVRRLVTETHPAIVRQTAELRELLGQRYDPIRETVEQA